MQLTKIELSNLAASLGVAESRQAFEQAVDSTSVESILLWLLAPEGWSEDDLRNHRPLLLAGQFAGMCTETNPALESLWTEAAKVCAHSTDFSDQWQAALAASGGWPLVPGLFTQLIKWLRGSISERYKALAWITHLDWDQVGSALADSVRRSKRYPRLGVHEHDRWASDVIRLMEQGSLEIMESIAPDDHPPRYVALSVRARLTHFVGWPDGKSLLVRYRHKSCFNEMVVRELAKLRNDPWFMSALRIVMAAKIPGIEQEVERTLLGRGHYFKEDMLLFLMRQAPARLLSVLKVKPELIGNIYPSEFASEAAKLTHPLLCDFADHFEKNEQFEALALLGDERVLPHLKKIEKSFRKNGELHRFGSLGQLVYLCHWPDEDVRDALLWRIENDSMGWAANQAARLLAVQGEVELLWQRILTKEQEDRGSLDWKDILALGVGAVHSDSLGELVCDFLFAAAMGNTYDSWRMSPAGWKHKQIASVMGLHIMNPPHLPGLLHHLLRDCASLAVRLLAAEALEQRNLLECERAILPHWRDCYSPEFKVCPTRCLMLHSLANVKRVICDLEPMNFEGINTALIWKDLAGPEHGELLVAERRRTFQPHWLVDVLRTPDTNPNYETCVNEFAEANACVLSSFHSHWKGQDDVPRELIELLKTLDARDAKAGKEMNRLAIFPEKVLAASVGPHL